MLPTYDEELAERLASERARYGNNRRFYKRAEWRHLRASVIAEFRGCCADCLERSPSVVTPATCVHHEMTVEDWPGWALSEWYVDQGGVLRRQLWPLCHECHDRRHGRQGRWFKNTKEPLTPERW